jgi:hypothetical protein
MKFVRLFLVAAIACPAMLYAQTTTNQGKFLPCPLLSQVNPIETNYRAMPNWGGPGTGVVRATRIGPEITTDGWLVCAYAVSDTAADSAAQYRIPVPAGQKCYVVGQIGFRCGGQAR